jgi:hypothetical protein
MKECNNRKRANLSDCEILGPGVLTVAPPRLLFWLWALGVLEKTRVGGNSEDA